MTGDALGARCGARRLRVERRGRASSPWIKTQPLPVGSTSIALLGHRKIIEERLEHACEEVAKAKRQEFMED